MTNEGLCPECGAKLKLVAYQSGAATGQKYEKNWICPVCGFKK